MWMENTSIDVLRSLMKVKERSSTYFLMMSSSGHLWARTRLRLWTSSANHPCLYFFFFDWWYLRYFKIFKKSAHFSLFWTFSLLRNKLVNLRLVSECCCPLFHSGFRVGSDSKESAWNMGDLGQEDPLEEGMATHSSILAWRIPVDRGAWRASQRIRHDRATQHTHIHTHSFTHGFGWANLLEWGEGS